ncbi:LptF/LptG family permease [Ferruginibacter albus]|uniref:LptF/LptG family permease n=1 Tax=Ferruginibacter albus TaxID=2875540 RepID=UPI001CC6A1BC|nr:LptF/LptG family permease [Ferruginibacter albus]UAY51387.1 LptF/LptG family permease [Ferruginibacter albus]
MKKIDSYILKKFLTTFFFCLLLFTAIVVVVDISEKTEDFVRIKFSFWQLVTNYYIGFIPHIDAMLFPLFVFISVIFFTSRMADRSEVVAILSSGVSYRRFLFPYWIGSIFLALLLWVGYQYTLPKANKIWGDFLTRYIDSQNSGSVDLNRPANIYFKGADNSYIGLRSYDAIYRNGSTFFVQQFADNKLKYDLRAQSISWDTIKKQWTLNQVVEHYFTGEKERIVRTSVMKKKYDFKPEDLHSDDYFKDRLTSSELNSYINKSRLSGSEIVKSLLLEKYNRDAIPASIIILTIIAVSLASRKTRGGSGLNLGVGVILSVLYVLSSRFSVVFAEKGNFTPWLAAWTPNIIFGALAYYLYKRAMR